MRSRARRLRYRPNAPGGYPGYVALDGEEKVARIDWCRGVYHLTVKGFGYAAACKSEASAKRMVRYYLRQVRRHPDRPFAERAAL